MVHQKFFALPLVCLLLFACVSDEATLDLAALETKYSAPVKGIPAPTLDEMKEWFGEYPLTHGSACDTGRFYDAYIPDTTTPESLTTSPIRNLALRWRESAHIAIAYGDYGEAIRFIRAGGTVYPSDWQLELSRFIFTEAAMRAIVGDRLAAETTFRRAVRRLQAGRSQAPQTYGRYKRYYISSHNAGWAMVSFASQEFRKAELLLREIRFQELDDAVNHRLIDATLALAVARQGRLEEAKSIVWLSMSFMIEDPIVGAWYADAYSYALIEQGQYEYAEWLARLFVDFFDDRCAPMQFVPVHRLYVRLADALSGSGRQDEALQIYNQVIERAANDDTGWFARLLEISPNLSAVYQGDGGTGS